jgi:hypothetical protein
MAGRTMECSYEVYTSANDHLYGYGGTALLSDPSLYSGGGTSVGEISAEVRGFNSGWVVDDHGEYIATNLLTNPIYGLDLSIPNYQQGQDGTINSSLAQWCVASGLLQAVAISNQASAAEHIEKVLASCDGTMVWQGGNLRMYPWAESDVTGNGVTFTAWKTPIYDLAEDSMSGTLVIRTENLLDTPNEIPVRFLERNPEGADATPSARYIGSEICSGDQAGMSLSGHRRGTAIETNLSTQVSAQLLSHILSRRASYYQNEYSFTIGRRHIMLEPFDLVTLSDTRLGFDHKIVRLTSMTLNEDESISCTAVEWLGVPFPTLLPTPEPSNPQQPSASTPPVFVGNLFVAASPVVGERNLLVTASALTPENWGGADIFYSWDDATFTRAGTVLAGNFGHVVGTLPLALPLDDVNILRVDMENARGTILPRSDADRDSLQSLLLVGDELIAYSDSTVVSGLTKTWDVGSLLRGQRGSSMSAHVEGEPVLLIDSNVLSIPYDKVRTGSLVYVRALAKNLGGSLTQALGDVTSRQYTIPAVVVPVQSAPLTETFDAFDSHRYTMPDMGSVLSIQQFGSAGGRCLRAVGADASFILDTNVPIDPLNTYCLKIRARQFDDPSSGTKILSAGLVGIAADGETYYGKTGAATFADQPGGVAVSMTEGTTWSEYYRYFKGEAATGLDGSTLISAPSPFKTDTKYARIWFTMNGGSVGGTQEVDEVELSIAPRGTQIVPATITADRLSCQQATNLWPNGNSEAPIPDGALTFAYGPNASLNAYPNFYNAAAEFGHLSASGTAFSGANVRELVCPAGSYKELHLWLPVLSGDKYNFSAWARRLSGSGDVRIRCMSYDNAFHVLSGTVSTYYTTTSWVKNRTKLTCDPGGAYIATWGLFAISIDASIGTETTAEFDGLCVYRDDGLPLAVGRVNANGTMASQKGHWLVQSARNSLGHYTLTIPGYPEIPYVQAFSLIDRVTPSANAVPTNGVASVNMYYTEGGVFYDAGFDFVIF